VFPKFKTILKVSRFQTIEEIQENPIRELCAIIVRSRKNSKNGRKFGNGVSPVEGTPLKGAALKNPVK